jgi:vacuolar-type H+-ATPase subunit F/Vma7
MIVNGPGKHRKIAVVADKRTITFFKLAGLKHLFPIENVKDAEKCVSEISTDPDYLIVLITDLLANKIHPKLEELLDQKSVLFIPIPSVENGVKVKVDLINELIKRKAGIEFKL